MKYQEVYDVAVKHKENLVEALDRAALIHDRGIRRVAFQVALNTAFRDMLNEIQDIETKEEKMDSCASANGQLLDGIEALKVMMDGKTVAWYTSSGAGVVHYHIQTVDHELVVQCNFPFKGEWVGWHEAINTFKDFLEIRTRVFVEVVE